MVHGVEVKMTSSDRLDTIAALAKRRDTLPELAKAASHERDKARRLSWALNRLC